MVDGGGVGGGTCCSSRASLFIVVSGLVSPSLSSRLVKLASLREQRKQLKLGEFFCCLSSIDLTLTIFIKNESG